MSHRMPRTIAVSAAAKIKKRFSLKGQMNHRWTLMGRRFDENTILYSRASSFVIGEHRAEDFDTHYTDFHECKIEDVRNF